MTNFGFLSDITEYALFAQAAIEAEKVWVSSPAMCAVGCRKALELAVKWVYSADKTIDMPYKDNLQSLIKEMVRTYKSAPSVYTLDVAIKDSGETVIIECHRFFSCGLYGFSDYRRLPVMFTRTWKEMIR